MLGFVYGSHNKDNHRKVLEFNLEYRGFSNSLVVMWSVRGKFKSHF